MNVFLLLIPAGVFYVLAQRWFVPRLARAFGEDDNRVTPAVALRDDVDYVPTRPHVLFAHHFSAIAAAGPILGPTIAILYGYLPAFFWIVCGAVLIGAVHDYACLYVSVREGGRSIAEIARKTMGNGAFLLFALFIVFNLVVVNAVFINLTAVSLTSLRAPEALGLPADQTLFRTVSVNGTPQAVVGGIASTSAIALTIIAPALGFVVVRRRMRERFAYPLATVLCIGSVLVGFALPVSMPELSFDLLGRPVHLDPTQIWIVLISLYVFVAAALPVWLVLQPREFVSVQFLYLGIVVLVAALIGLGFKGVPIQAPPLDVEHGQSARGALWPVLFVTIACGAVSGFHGLVGSGTTSKQVMRESHARLGYTAMLGESALALCVALTIAAGMSYAEYNSFLIRPEGAGPNWRENPVLAFATGVAGVCESGLGIPKWLGVVFGMLMIEGFVLDTLDVSIRLNRYLLEEIWSVMFGWLRRVPVEAARVPGFLRNYWFNSGLCVALMLAISYRNTADSLWPIFGTGNQLMASLSLVSMGVWMYAHGRRVVYVGIPAVLVGVTTLASLIYLLWNDYWPKGKYLLAAMDVLYLCLALGVLWYALRALLRVRRERHGGAAHAS